MPTETEDQTPEVAVAPTHKHKHAVVRQVKLLRDALQSDKVRVGCLLGAGCPSGVYQADGTKGDPLIPDVAKLTQGVRDSLVLEDEAREDAEKLLGAWDLIAEACKQGGVETPNIEHILSELRTLRARRGPSVVDGVDKEKLRNLDEKVCDLIVDSVGKGLPSHRCSYNRFASWVGGVERVAPVELFTPNYDLLLEEAFDLQRIPIFDGFVGSREPFFDLASIEQDAIPRRWTRLWKLHGSINWEFKRDEETDKITSVFRAQGRASAGKAIIYPSHLKYDESRRMPYLAMIDRLRAFFRIGGHSQGFGPPVMIVVGYSFADDHLNEVLLDGLRGNPAAHCFVLTYPSLKDAKAVVRFASEQPNLTVLAYDGAVIGTRVGSYDPMSSGAIDSEPWLTKTVTTASDGVEESEVINCSLGDFHYFGLFLESLYGSREDEMNG